MISILEYLDNIFRDFSEYVLNENNLCKLKTVNYNLKELPDYNDVNIQQFYLLRYGFVYAFEYKRMFQRLLRNCGFEKQIEVLSTGCGAGIDYWSIASTLADMEMNDYIIKYYGVDNVDWNYKMDARETDYVRYLPYDAVRLFNGIKKFKFDIYMFPKSISEFSKEDFNHICDSIETKEIEKNRIHLLVSLRSTNYLLSLDCERTKKLANSLLKQGFKTRDDPNQFINFINQKKGIAFYDCSFTYPSDALEFISTLNEKCCRYLENGQNCVENCKSYLTRKPSLTPSIIRYQVLTFER